MADTDYMGIDKLYHLLVCLGVAILHPYLAIGLALGKEYGDYKNPSNHWCWYDIIADAIGTAAGSAIWYWILPLIF